MSNRRSRSRSPRRRRSSGGSPARRSRPHPSSPSRSRARTFSEGGRGGGRERERVRDRERRDRERERRDRDRERERERERDRGRGRENWRDWRPNRRRDERWSRGEEQKQGWEGLRRRGSHSPQAQREAGMDGAERIVRDRSKQDTWTNRTDTVERMDSQQFDGRRNTGGRERGWNHGRGGGSRALRPDDSDEAADRQRLLESLIDPQDVPRSGDYYEHDDRDAPPGQQQRRLRQSMPSSGRRWSPPEPRGRLRERGARFRRHSSDERVWRRDRDRGGGERERDRWERRGQDGGEERRGKREEWEVAAGGKWKHDMFEQLEKETLWLESDTPAETGMVASTNDIEGVWAHDKFEEMEASAMDNVVAMDTEA